MTCTALLLLHVAADLGGEGENIFEKLCGAAKLHYLPWHFNVFDMEGNVCVRAVCC